MQRHERLNSILELLADAGQVSVDEIVQRFDVSAPTVRRDLDELAGQHLISRTRGGAALKSTFYDLPLRYKTARQSQEKQRIAAAAAASVEIGSVVGLNGGTTTSAVARVLAGRADLATLDGDGLVSSRTLTVVTNALNIANELVVRPYVKLVVTGGVVRPHSFELIGPMAGRTLDGIAIDTLFLGVDGISTDGTSTVNEGEAAINRMMVERSNQVVVVADGSKIGRRTFVRICDCASVDRLLTDESADPDVIDELEAAGISVEVV